MRLKSLRAPIPAVFLITVFVSYASLQRSAVAMEIFAMAGAPNSQSNPSITSYPSIANFQANTNGSTTNRNTAQNTSCDFAVLADGTIYYMAGNAANSGNKTIYSWPSIAAWSTNSSVTNLGTRGGAAATSGMAIYQNELYVLEGAMDVSGTKVLMKWPSIASWVSGSTGTEVGNRSVGSGIGFDIGLDGTVYFLQVTSNSSPEFANEGILYTWPTITDFLADSNVSSNGGQFLFFGSTNFIAGLAVPEPSTYVMATLSCLTLAVARRWRKLGKANR